MSSDYKQLDSHSAELLWPMYKNAKNLLPYRYRMENLIWRMMFVKAGKRLLRDDAHAKLELSSFIQTPLLGLAVTDRVDEKKDEFNYVAHIRKMSEAVGNQMPTRKRPAPMLPFMTHTGEPEPSNGLGRPSIHLNLSAAFKGKSPEHEDHGYSFLLDSFALEGPLQSDFSHQDPFSQYSEKNLPSTLPNMPTSALYHGEFSAPPFNDMNIDQSPRHSSHTPSLVGHGFPFAPKAIGVPTNTHYPSNKRQTPLLLYGPSSFTYPVGPASILLETVIKQENSLVSVSDHFASSLRPYTPYEFDEQTSMADSYFPGMLNKDALPSNTPLRGSLAEPRMYDDEPKVSYFDNAGQSNFANQFKQKQKPLYDDKQKGMPNFWIDDHFNDSSSPQGSVSTSASGTYSGLNRMASLPKKKGKKAKPKRATKLDKMIRSEESTPSVEAKQPAKKSASLASSKVPSLGANIECTNCFTKTTPLWRRNPQGEPLCNACGLFLKLHGTVRPLSLKTDVIKKRQRGQVLGQGTRKSSTANSSVTPKPKNERDGDDFSPAPIGKAKAFNLKKPQDPVSGQKTLSVEETKSSAGDLSPQTDILHLINELVKENDWNPVEHGDSAMFDGAMSENKSQWDWLSMNI